MLEARVSENPDRLRPSSHSLVSNMELQAAVKKWAVMPSSFTKLVNTTSQLLHKESEAAGVNGDESEGELSGSDEYNTKYSTFCVQKSHIVSSEGSTGKCTGASNRNESMSKRKYRLPKVELIKYGGELSEWLGFWSQFSNIDEDEEALETLGISSDKYTAMLFPIVGPFLTEDLPRAWLRSGVFHIGDNRLVSLMEFLRKEIKQEERISIIIKGFNIASLCDNRVKEPSGSEMETSIATAADLVNTKRVPNALTCIFCQGAHFSWDGFKERRTTTIEKLKNIDNSHCCFVYLRGGHVSKRCKMTCVVNGAKHMQLICPKLEVVKPKPHGKTLQDNEEKALANHSSSDTLMQMLIVRIKGKTGDRHISILIDTGSQRSYITKELVAKVGYQSVGEEELRHGLISGHQSNKANHKWFHITLENPGSNYVCGFDDLDQDTICSSVPTVKREVCQRTFKDTGVTIKDDTSPIQVLVRADVAGRLLSGERIILEDGLVAFNTYLGWTVMGKVSDTELCSQTMIVDVLGIGDPEKQRTREDLVSTVKEHFERSIKRNVEKKKDMRPSPNDSLEEGPNLIAAIRLLLLWFRLKPIGVIADIKKAFLHTSLSERDRDFVQFLLKHKGSHIIALRHTRAVFGVISSPFILEALARIPIRKKQSLLYRKVFYVDNCVTSVRDDELYKFIEESTSIFREANFELRGRASDVLYANSAIAETGPGHVTKRKILFICTQNFQSNWFYCSCGVNSKIIDPTDEEGQWLPSTKKSTIPRLELLAATTATRLASKAAGNLGIDKLDFQFWSDSTTVITWIQREDTWGVFVHNMVQEIRRLSDQKSWHYVAETMNPAEMTSLGYSAEVLLRSKWWEGPEWLKKTSEWPIFSSMISEDEANLEKIPGVILSLTSSCVMPQFPDDRVRHAPVFEVIGVDMADPLYFKDWGKAWIFIFTCAVYRAVNLELVTSLSTETFIRSVRRSLPTMDAIQFFTFIVTVAVEIQPLDSSKRLRGQKINSVAFKAFLIQQSSLLGQRDKCLALHKQIFCWLFAECGQKLYGMAVPVTGSLWTRLLATVHRMETVLPGEVSAVQLCTVNSLPQRLSLASGSTTLIEPAKDSPRVNERRDSAGSQKRDLGSRRGLSEVKMEQRRNESTREATHVANHIRPIDGLQSDDKPANSWHAPGTIASPEVVPLTSHTLPITDPGVLNTNGQSVAHILMASHAFTICLTRYLKKLIFII
ncbi:hypothetical protein PR048_009152 [Dryococelus australis]|uniref:Peptidase aspartic putative domain-containing protein n=1 Tax=Dryococelus australis TaxID=614101 RepID=A0ABQ9HZ33_9NEOP|nr:hypothetical protein PR048_009152 [Dryococelus australis]